MDKSIDFAARPTAAYVITNVEERQSRIAGLRLFDIGCEKPGARRRLVIYSRDGDVPGVGFHLIHKRLSGGFAAMWSDTAGTGDRRLIGGGFTIACVPSSWKTGAAA